ncbi:MAG: HTTM domain-containing protein [Nonlabens sp.]
MNLRYRPYQLTNAAPLAVFRILFGLMMTVAILRFWYHGWIEKLYLSPSFHFSYYGFSAIKPVGDLTYVIFAICGITAFMVVLGAYYRLAIITFFLSFTYIELMDATTYLNHYYFISAVSFIMIFLPAHRYFSIDVRRGKRKTENIFRYQIDVLKIMLGIVYVYAGLAKMNSDWLLKAMPLRIWLPSKYDLPILGKLLQQEWVAYFFSWSGMLYDLFIPFLLLYRPTRKAAFIAVVIFHVLTRVLFPIGMFPFVMIAGALIFFEASFHKKLIRLFYRLKGFVGFTLSRKRNHFHPRQPFLTPEPVPNTVSEYLESNMTSMPKTRQKLVYPRLNLTLLSVIVVVQLLLPWRHLSYPDELFWTEEGYRFSWRVMLMEKMGIAQFKVVHGSDDKQFYVQNDDFLSSFQEKQMSFQPDFILQYAQYLDQYFTQQGYENVRVYADVFVALNGRPSKRFIDPDVDLSRLTDNFKHKDWILEMNDAIEGI